MFTYFLIFFGALLRLIPHPANFVPLAAIGLFGGVYLSKRQAILLPILAMLASDVFIGFDSVQSRLVVYSSILIASLLGILIRNHKNVFTVLGASLAGSSAFFLLTNLVWFYPATMYPHTLAGQINSYVNALPFFRNTVAGDLVYTIVFFGAYELVQLAYKKKSYVAGTAS